ncbi:hypothetical protein HY251_05175 [bacterium]|nr:hypothetical protein [bacterium]
MPSIIEPAKSGRAACRTCKEPIAKGELRLGVEAPNMFGDDGAVSYQWHHLACGAKKKPVQLKEAMASFTGEIPGRADLEKALDEAGAKAKPAKFPYAELASTGRARCQECEEPLEKGKLRVAIEREVETGSFVTKGAGYLHPRCAKAHVGDPDLLSKIQANSLGLTPAHLEELGKELA